MRVTIRHAGVFDTARAQTSCSDWDSNLRSIASEVTEVTTELTRPEKLLASC